MRSAGWVKEDKVMGARKCSWANGGVTLRRNQFHRFYWFLGSYEWGRDQIMAERT